MRERTAFPRALLERLPRLKLLVTTGMRNASIDVEAAAERGITVCGTSGSAVSDRRADLGAHPGPPAPHPDRGPGDARRPAGRPRCGLGLNGKTLGVLGLGTLGSRVAKVGRAFEMDVLAWSQNLTAARAAEVGATLVTKDELLRARTW